MRLLYLSEVLFWFTAVLGTAPSLHLVTAVRAEESAIPPDGGRPGRSPSKKLSPSLSRSLESLRFGQGTRLVPVAAHARGFSLPPGKWRPAGRVSESLASERPPSPPPRSDSLQPGPIDPGQPASLRARRYSLPAGDLRDRKRTLRSRRWSFPAAVEARLRGPLAPLAAAVPSSRDSLPRGAEAPPASVAPVRPSVRPKQRGQPREEVAPGSRTSLFEVIVDTGAREVISNAARDAREDEQASTDLQFIDLAFPIAKGEHFFIEALEGGRPFLPMKFQREGVLGLGGNGIVFEATHTATGISFAMKMPRIQDKKTVREVSTFQTMAPLQRKRLVDSIHRRMTVVLQESSIGEVMFKGQNAMDVLKEDHFVIPIQPGARIKDKGPFLHLADTVLLNHVGIYPVGYASVYTLLTQIEASRRLKEEIGRQMIQAISNLEKRGWLHGDVKSDNFFIFPRGIVALGDLANLSPAVDANGRPVETDCSRRLEYGSPAYFAPELADCIRRQTKLVRTPPTEWWALGVSLYEMFCDMRIPYNLDPIFDKSLTSFFDALREFPVVRPMLTFENCDIGVDWQNVIRGLLEIDPQERTSPSFLLEKAPGVVQPRASPPAEREGGASAAVAP